MQLQALTQSLAPNTLLYLLIHSHIYNYTLPTLHCSPNWPPIIALRGLYCNLIMPNVPIVSLLCQIFLLFKHYYVQSYCNPIMPEAPLGKHLSMRCHLYLGIAQIAITPPRTQTGTLGHFFQARFYPFYHFFYHFFSE